MTNEQIQSLHQNIGVLRAMASNYAAGRHCWDHLDGEAVSKAADGIECLLAGRDDDKALIAQLREHNRILAGDGIIKQDRIAELEAEIDTPIGYVAGDAVKGMYRGRSRFCCLYPEPKKQAVLPVYVRVPVAKKADTITVKLPTSHNNSGFVTDGIRNKTIEECHLAFIEACAAAGITLVVEE